eukprot:3520490-Pyramimonas_sp.AAC.1
MNLFRWFAGGRRVLPVDVPDAGRGAHVPRGHAGQDAVLGVGRRAHRGRSGLFHRHRAALPRRGGRSRVRGTTD